MLRHSDQDRDEPRCRDEPPGTTTMDRLVEETRAAQR